MNGWIATVQSWRSPSTSRLKNENNLLPLSKDVGTIAVLGPNADESRLGGYSPHEAEGIAGRDELGCFESRCGQA